MPDSRVEPWLVTRFFDFFDVLVDLGVALFALKLWLFPSPGDVGNILTFCFVMVVEFIMLHSGTMMAFARGFSRLLPLVFVPLYGLFILAFYLAANDSYVLWMYCFVVLMRILGSAFVTDAAVLVRRFKCSFIQTFIYFFSLMIVVALCESIIPELGLTAPFLVSSGYREAAKDAYGLMPYKPHIALCAAVVYYSALAVFDFWVAKYPRKLEKPM